MKKNSWQKEVLRDVEALGSLVFVIVVASRSLVGQHWRFLLSLVIAVVLSYFVWHVIKYLSRVKSSSHASNVAILLVLVGGFYQSVSFTLFTLVFFGVLLWAHKKLRKHSYAELALGIVNGLISAGIGAYLTYYWILPR
jgi:cbb3-type cytochrome oxidase subunit 3